MISNKLNYLEKGAMSYEGIIAKIFKFANEEQLLNDDLWKEFVDVFSERPDGNDCFWRGEYWGKMMRGGCLCYHYENDPKLYASLRKAVIGLLATQDELGRISSYSVDKEFDGWDMWSRKYVMTGLIHFYQICDEKELKEQIVEALEKHADYIIAHVGHGEEKKEITETSPWWLGVNSASILEPFVALYRITNEKRYLDFAGYVVSTGGIRGGNLVDIAREGKLHAYQYPEEKAYETMSFFEGVLDYAEVTDDEELMKVCIAFYDDVAATDITITGNAGAEEEIFNNAAIKQTIKPEKFAQETCVSVTWMRVNSKLMLLTGDPKYYERLELTARNAFLGSLNFYHQSARDWFGKKDLPYLPFDSYSPLRNDRRGKSTGGLCYLPNGHYYGCCACIGSASIGLTALNTVLSTEKGIRINDYYTGTVKVGSLDICIKETLTENGRVMVKINNSSESVEIELRIPSWAHNPRIVANGKEVLGDKIAKVEAKNGETLIALDFNPQIDEFELNGLIALKYGPLVLAVEEECNPDLVLENLKLSEMKDWKLAGTYEDEAQVRFSCTNNGETIYIKDYASSAKRWDIERNRLTVWLDR